MDIFRPFYVYFFSKNDVIFFSFYVSIYDGPSVKEQIKNFFYFHDRCLGGENKKTMYTHNYGCQRLSQEVLIGETVVPLLPKYL